MNKQILIAIFYCLFTTTLFAQTQNIFPTSGNTGIGTITLDAKLQINTTDGLYGCNYTNIPAFKINYYLGDYISCISATGGLGGGGITGTPSDIIDIRRYPFGPVVPLSSLGYTPVMVVNSNGNMGLSMMPTNNYRLSVSGHSYFTGKVQIGALKPTGIYSNYTLSVNGDIICKRAVVQTSSWADYVFKSNYKLMPLNKVEEFIRINNHLPNMPSEKAIIESGQDVAEIQKLQQAKIEELTLYIIELKKEIDLIKSKN